MRFDLRDQVVDELNRVGYEYAYSKHLALQGSGDQRKAYCPFHHNTRTPALGINVKTGSFLCRNPACEKKGDYLDFHQAITGTNFPETLRLIAKEIGLAVPDPLPSLAGDPPSLVDRRHGGTERQSNPPIPDSIVIGLHDCLLNNDSALEFLMTRRGLTLETISEFQLGFDGRFTIPIRDSDGQVVNVRRYSPDEEPKMWPWKTGYGRARLFPLDRLRSGDPVVILEGELDTLLARQHGLNAVTGTGGAGTWLPEWNEWFVDRDVVICYDVDGAGRNGSDKVAHELYGIARSIRVITLPLTEPGADFTDFLVGAERTIEEFQALVEASPLYAPALGSDPGLDHPRNRPRFTLIHADDLNESLDVPFLVPGIVPEGIVTIIGEPSVGKSFAALALALAMTTGTQWLGRDVVQGDVIYVAGEGQTGLSARIAAWKEHSGVATTGRLYILDQILPPLERGAIDNILAEVRRLGLSPKLIIIDTWGRALAATGDDENSATDTGAAINELDRLRRETGASLLLPHHPSRAGNERGSTALRAAVDAQIRMTRAPGDTIEMTCDKMKDAADFEALTLALVPCASSAVLVTRDPGAPAPRPDSEQLNRVDTVVLLALKDHFPLTEGASSGQWMTVSGYKSTAFNRARTRLLAKNLVRTERIGRGVINYVVDSVPAQPEPSELVEAL